MELRGARALVVGGAHRLGAAIALALAADGARVAITYHRSAAEAAETGVKLAALGGEAPVLQVDVADPARAVAAVAEAAAAMGGLDLLVFAASGGFEPCSPEQVDPALFEAALGSTLRGGFFCAQAAHQAMAEGGGVIVLITDIAGMEREHWPLFAPHCAAKAGLIHLTGTLARAWGPEVRVCGVAPGTVLMPDAATDESARASAQQTVLRRNGSPDDVIEAIRFLVRNEYVTGTQIVVDGGRLTL